MHPKTERITVLVVDDDDAFRLLVGIVLAHEADITIVGQAGTWEEGVALAETLCPDVVLLDLSMPGGGGNRGGIEAATAISRQVPTSRIVMLTASEADNDAYEALGAGASGYVVKDGSLADLAGLIRTMAHELGLLLPPSIASKVLTQFRTATRASGGSGLSDRELEVLRLVALARTNDQIAAELFLSSHTVKRHVANILAKLHQPTRADAVKCALRNGYLVDADTVLSIV